MPTPHPKAATPATKHGVVLSALLEPFGQLAPEKQELLREVLQVYVSKDAAQRTDLDKRHRVSSLINDYAKSQEGGK